MRSLKNRIAYVVVGLVYASVLFFIPVPSAKADSSSNIVANGNLEQSSGSPAEPVDWSPESWGVNSSTFNYLTTGYNSSNSVQTIVSGYSSGDAKWIFNPVSITGGNSHQYTDWYESSAVTNIWAEYTLNDGTTQYVWLGADQAASSWTETSETFTAPSNAVSVSVLHVINANGQLTLDDVYLSVPCTPTYVNGLANGSFDQTCPNSPNVPSGWFTQTYGPDPADYGYSTTDYNGSPAVTITNSSANDEAGWTTNILSPLSNQRYQLSFWQEGTTYVYAYVNETLTNGSTQSVSLMSAPSTAGIFGTNPPTWSQYTDAFVTPTNLQSMQIVIATSGEGTLALANVTLNLLTNQNPTIFNSGMVSVTLDDNFVDQYTNGVKTLNEDGLKGTFYVVGGTIGTKGYMTRSQLIQTANDGNEIASHQYHLSDEVELSTSTLVSEITGNIAYLQQMLGSQYPITDFASPYGSYTSSDTDTVMQYEQSDRTTDGEMNTKANLDLSQIHARLVLPTTTPAEVESWIAQAQTEHDWLVLVYHGITRSPLNSEEAQYATKPGNFIKEMSYLEASGITVDPVNQALTSLEAQINQ
ncbi:MAG TPA: polysaccharide deacetylase family protein [Candidatus Saccharimonadales bacterium]|nr:polysaccharide deacetylase family protein [Candidatus Saccharimonadales bacterium]